MKKRIGIFILGIVSILSLCILIFSVVYPQVFEQFVGRVQMIHFHDLVHGHKVRFLLDVADEPSTDDILDQLLSAATIGNQIIVLVLLFLIPMIVMIVLLAIRKDKKGTLWNYIQKFMSYSLGFFGLFCCMFYGKNLVAFILLMIGMGALALVTLLDMILNKKTDIISLFFETTGLVAALFLSISERDYLSSFMITWAFCSIVFIYMIIKMNVKNESFASPYLPFGILKRRRLWFKYLYLTLSFSVAFILTIDHAGYFFLSLLLIILLNFILSFGYSYFIDLKAFRKYQKNLDIDSLEKEVLKFQNLPNVHPDTLCHYRLLFMQYVLVHDKTKFFEYYKMCNVPQSKKTLYFRYRCMMLRYGMTQEEFEHAHETLKKEFYNKQSIVKKIDKFYQFWSPYYGTNPKNISLGKLYKTNRKNAEHQNAISLFLLIHYYKNENQLDKVAELKTTFLKKYSMMTEFTKDLESL
ncbi:hypothetical protein HDR67_00740 [bacterium]|nr:hypothetical protein [bacterium]